MNIRSDFVVLLRIEAPELPHSRREHLFALLCDYPLDAIHEEDAEPGIAWNVSFGERAWQPIEDLEPDDPTSWAFARDETTLAPLDVNWRRWPDLSDLMTAEAGKLVTARFGGFGVHCRLLANPAPWSITTFEESHGRVQVGRIIVAPPWHFPDLDDATIILKIKPSMGFGTGHHPSTRLALSLLQKVQCAGRDVLDVGTGCGVLAMAAARLGATRVCAIDRDPDAVVAAAEGLHRNRLTDRVELRQADISTDAIGRFQLVIANLDALQIEAWSESLRQHVDCPGQLLLSGFPLAEADLVLAALRQQPSLIEQEDGWAAVLIDYTAE